MSNNQSLLDRVHILETSHSDCTKAGNAKDASSPWNSPVYFEISFRQNSESPAFNASQMKTFLAGITP